MIRRFHSKKKEKFISSTHFKVLALFLFLVCSLFLLVHNSKDKNGKTLKITNTKKQNSETDQNNLPNFDESSHFEKKKEKEQGYEIKTYFPKEETEIETELETEKTKLETEPKTEPETETELETEKEKTKFETETEKTELEKEKTELETETEKTKLETESETETELETEKEKTKLETEEEIFEQEKKNARIDQAKPFDYFHFEDHKYPGLNVPDHPLTSYDYCKEEECLEEIREMFLHGWKAYKKYAWGMDDVHPKTKRGSNWMGLGLTIIDSIDTMWILGLTKEYEEAREWIKTGLDFSNAVTTSFFELTIRVLGGLISIFDLTQDELYKDKADELGQAMLNTFASQSCPFPHSRISLKHLFTNNHAKTNNAILPFRANSKFSSNLAESYSFTLEFARLSEITNNPIYRHYADQAIKKLEHIQNEDGVYATHFTCEGEGTFKTSQSSKYSIQSFADSAYEYFLKVWLLDGSPKQSMYRDHFDHSLAGIQNVLLQKKDDGLWYVGVRNIEDHHFDSRMEHLTCFIGGLSAMSSLNYDDFRNGEITIDPSHKSHFQFGNQITRTCAESYSRSKTGLGPFRLAIPLPSEDVHGRWHTQPETIESVFYLWRITHHPYYRNWGYQLIRSIQRHARIENGFATVKDISNLETGNDDETPSFFFSETLKYLFLLFSDDNVVPLNKWVFNTEAHPFRIKEFED
ncbi:mannosyl-oligosaccharide alpha-12-mannosidase-related [Anaeramoeba flamelloides]|uniref:alpha-1,2-Mannosidase n=1 Tax=Anaeramoeba flamelloides TaxID=1746091 RepID=A0AAV7Y776_9EUKA|nr:mannosyl-oligosaccharide alpha-12-mannosidase-related [Anaeramoeba flamelloides]